MVRIRPYRCGYGNVSGTRGYECIGLSSLAPVFTGGPVYDEYKVRTDFSATGSYAYINNYYNLPVHIKGFVMTGVPVLMATSGIAKAYVYENNCQKTPWLYVKTAPLLSYSKHDWRASAENVPEDYSDYSAGMTGAQTDGFWHNIEHEQEGAESRYALNFSPEAATADSRQLMPGLLEPMLDTDLPNIDISGLSEIDAGFDGIAVAFAALSQWRNRMAGGVNMMIKSRDDTNPEDNGCPEGSWRLKLKSGSMYGERGDPKPHFEVVNGPVRISCVHYDSSGTAGEDSVYVIPADDAHIDTRITDDFQLAAGVDMLKVYVIIRYVSYEGSCFRLMYMEDREYAEEGPYCYAPVFTNLLKFTDELPDKGYYNICIGTIRRVTSKSGSVMYSIEAGEACDIAVEFHRHCPPSATGILGNVVLETVKEFDKFTKPSDALLMSRYLEKAL